MSSIFEGANSVVEIDCPFQQYAWGKFGKSSYVAQLKEKDEKFTIDESGPYAELWMGTHVNGKAMVNDQPLASLIAAKPEVSVKYPAAYESYKKTGELPYLFKILSVRTALSIQAHPDKALAERIHAEQPTIYKDPNHKPEMALAITPMEALCQFRPLAEIASHLKSELEFREMCGDAESLALEQAAAGGKDNTPEGKAALQALFKAFMTTPEEATRKLVSQVVGRLSAIDWSMRTPTQSLVLRCNEQFPGDIGCFCPFLLNYITLEPGEAIFLAANEPHAYLSGDLAECMACSDNVIRSGLTPKFKDVELLCKCLTYGTGRAPVNKGVAVDKCSKLYTPPIPEFEMLVTTVPPAAAYIMPATTTPMITLVVGGSGTVNGAAAVKGSTFFSVPGAKVDIQAGEEGILMYSAHCNESNL